MSIDLESRLQHLRRHYAQQTPIFDQIQALKGLSGDVPYIPEGRPSRPASISLAQLQRLMRHVRAEHEEGFSPQRQK